MCSFEVHHGIKFRRWTCVVLPGGNLIRSCTCETVWSWPCALCRFLENLCTERSQWLNNLIKKRPKEDISCWWSLNKEVSSECHGKRKETGVLRWMCQITSWSRYSHMNAFCLVVVRCTLCVNKIFHLNTKKASFVVKTFSHSLLGCYSSLYASCVQTRNLDKLVNQFGVTICVFAVVWKRDSRGNRWGKEESSGWSYPMGLPSTLAVSATGWR